MKLEICATAADAGKCAARLIAARLDAAVAARGRATVAFSGGHTPAAMFAALAGTTVAWPKVDVFQVDERIVGADDERRNLRAIRAAFVEAGVTPAGIHGMPVDDDPPTRAADAYAASLRAVAGTPATLDVVHLGLGADGHTASLFAGDCVLDATGDVALSGPYAGLRRMTLTLGALNRARSRIWLVTGGAKQSIVRRLIGNDAAIVAHRIRSDDSILVLDRDAAPEST